MRAKNLADEHVDELKLLLCRLKLDFFVCNAVCEICGELECLLENHLDDIDFTHDGDEIGSRCLVSVHSLVACPLVQAKELVPGQINVDVKQLEHVERGAVRWHRR